MHLYKKAKPDSNFVASARQCFAYTITIYAYDKVTFQIAVSEETGDYLPVCPGFFVFGISKACFL